MQPILDPEIWVEVIGEPQKGWLYGIGDREHAHVIHRKPFRWLD